MAGESRKYSVLLSILVIACPTLAEAQETMAWERTFGGEHSEYIVSAKATLSGDIIAI